MRADDPETIKLYGERTAKTTCQHLIPHIKPDDHILDVGCGLGTITADLVSSRHNS
jgi:cyclopropane fatty-acyl-phospholipid synthase-like methyltransferase